MLTLQDCTTGVGRGGLEQRPQMVGGGAGGGGGGGHHPILLLQREEASGSAPLPTVEVTGVQILANVHVVCCPEFHL